METIKDWGRVFVAVRYQPQNPAWFTESYAGLVQFGMRNAPGALVNYVEHLEMLLRANGIVHDLPRPESSLRQGDRRDFVYSKTMHKAANMLVRSFLQTDCDSICFIDSDAVYGTDALEELRSDPEGWGYDILQAFTVKRGFPPEPMFLTAMANQPQSDERLRGLHMVSNLPLDPDHIYPVDAVSLHFTLLRRELFEQMLEPEGPNYTYWFEYIRDNGEDINFSIKARAQGASLGMTTRLKVGHVSEVVTGWDTMVDYHFYKFMHQSGQLPAPSLEHFAQHYQAQMQLAELVSEYTGEPAQLVFDKSLEGGLSVRDKWLLEKPQTLDEVRAFYGNTPQYFYDLIRWNVSPTYQYFLKQLSDVRAECILELGGGIGTVSEFLATRGNRVDYYDLPGDLLEFAKWRFARLGAFQQQITVVAEWGGDQAYDRIIAIDVIEHIHPDEIGETLQRIGDALKGGGVLFAHNNFSQQGGAYPQHFDHSAAWDAFVKRQQLTQQNEFEWVKPLREEA